MSRNEKTRRSRLRQQTRELRRLISAMDYLVSGTLHSRTKVCGRKNCRCATDPDARHGPYHEWSRRRDGRLVHTIVTAQQAELLDRAIANQREVKRLLGLWDRLSEDEILNASPHEED